MRRILPVILVTCLAAAAWGADENANKAQNRVKAAGTILQEISKHTLAEVKIEDAEFFRPLAAIYKKNKVLSPAMKQFLAILKESQ